MRRVVDRVGDRRILEVRGHVFFQRKIGRPWRTVRRFAPHEPISAEAVAAFMHPRARERAEENGR